MKHWKAYIKIVVPDNVLKQFETTVEADNEFEAVNKFEEKYGKNCIIGWVKETKPYGLQSIGH